LLPIKPEPPVINIFFIINFIYIFYLYIRFDVYICIKLFNKILGENIEKHLNTTYNHKVISVEYLDYTSDTYNMEVYDKNENHNFLTSSGVVIKNSTISALDVRFSRTIERIQRIIISELEKIALIHLYVQGYEDADLVNFKLSLNNPSIIYEQEKIALLKEKFSLASDIMDKKLMSSDWIADKIFQMSEDQLNEQRELVVEDVKRIYRYNQIENEGNDPTVSGESYGTPHDLASVYNGANKKQEVPDGYNEKEPNPVGRPKEKSSIYGTDKSSFGRDPLGKSQNTGVKSNYSDRDIKAKPFAMEAIRGLQSIKNKKMVLFEQKNSEPSILDEKNVLGDIDNDN